MNKKVITILTRTWKPEDIHFWKNPKDGNDNASVLFNGKLSRLRAGIIIMKGNQILLGEEKDEPGVFSLPGGSINKDEDIIDAAKREAEEEVGIVAKNIEETGIDYCECHDQVMDWVKENVPEEEWWYNYYTCLCIGEYDKEYKGKIEKEDLDPSMKKSAEFYDLDEVIDDPSFKYAWKIALYNYGYLDEFPTEKEELQEKIVKTNKANIYLETSPYPVKDYMFNHLDNVTRIYWMRTYEDENVYGYADGSKVIHGDIADQISDYFYTPPEEGVFDDDEYTEEELEFYDAALVFYPYIYSDKIDYERGCFVRPTSKGYYLQYHFKEGILLCDDISFETSSLYTILKPEIIKRIEESLIEKIVKIGNKYQVQSEKGRNMGTYDNKEDAEKRLQQVHYFKHINEALPKDKIPEFLYHATYKPYLNEIKKDGKISINPPHDNWEMDNDRCIYLAANKDMARSFAETSDYVPEDFLNEIVILKIPSNKLDLEYLELDPNIDLYFDPEGLTDFCYAYYKDIPFSAVQELKESLTESSRTSLITKSKSADKYRNGRGSRWTQKSKCSVASTVKDYNKIDMDTFWKQDKLSFGIKVAGETNTYIVTISFKNILPKIQRKIKDNDNLLEFKCIYDALIQAINSGDVLVSCTCPDYQYRIKYWNSRNGDEAGEKETRKADITNPNDTKGPACKHILAVLNNVEWLNKVASVINNYINYCKDNMQYNYSKYMFPKLYGVPYNKVAQMRLDDYDEEGNLKDKLKSDESTINLINALGKVRGRFKKGSNRNPAAKKKEESLQESYSITEHFDIPRDLQKHFEDHCIKLKNNSYYLFKDIGLIYPTKEAYKQAAENFACKAKKGYMKIVSDKQGNKRITYVKFKEIHYKSKQIYLGVTYCKDKEAPERHVITYFAAPVDYWFKSQDNEQIIDAELPDEELNLKSWNEWFDYEENKQYESELISNYYKNKDK